MRFILATLLTAVFSWLAGSFLEWWSIALVSFLVGLLLPQSNGRSFLSGFLGIFLLWALLSLWIDVKNSSILSTKIAELFSLGGSSVLLILVTAIVGGIVGGFAQLSGSTLRKLFAVNKRRN